ncbi:hypothetical protein PV328_005279 [Microctonus aethiopoides]|uniref:Ribonuclease 3 n=1 Tax=Microctonus aethiopoides TaxID=144406 RepID=A0AA39FM19_9HYME|nr:hypothetical protein PV328_005279 [Microctonus aethiopoides]
MDNVLINTTNPPTWNNVQQNNNVEYYSVPPPPINYPPPNFIYPPPSFNVPPPPITNNQSSHLNAPQYINQQQCSYSNNSTNSYLPFPSYQGYNQPTNQAPPPSSTPVLSNPSSSYINPGYTGQSQWCNDKLSSSSSSAYNYNNVDERKNFDNSDCNNWSNWNENTSSSWQNVQSNPVIEKPMSKNYNEFEKRSKWDSCNEKKNVTSSWSDRSDNYSLSNSRSSYKSSRYVDRKDYYNGYSREKLNSHENHHRYHDNERRSSSRRSSISRSSTSSRDNRHVNRTRSSRKRSRSQESHSSSRTSTPGQMFGKQKKEMTEREIVLEKYRRNYCATSKDIERKIDELGPDGILESEKKIWTRAAPADLYYNRDEINPKIMRGTKRLAELCARFKQTLLDRAELARGAYPPYEPPPRKTKARLCRHKSEACSSSSGSDSDDSFEDDDRTMEELMAKKQHPQRLHPEMWFNDPGEMNDGPLCRCSAKSRRSGIRHGIYAGESLINRCDTNTNNADKLYHYRITISPPTNFLTKTPTIIKHDEHEFIFEGFSMLSHFPLVKLPTCKVIRFNIEYTILYIEEKLPENFTILELDYFQNYLFKEILELMDFDLHAAQDNSGCGQFHFMPRFVRDLPDKGQEILSMNEVLNYLIKSSTVLIDADDLERLIAMPQYEWQNFADEVKGMVVTYPGKKPCSVRVDQLDRTQGDQPPGVTAYPEIVHFGIRPPQLSYAGNADYQKAWRDYVKFRHLLANMPKPSFDDKRKLEAKENRLQELRTQSKMKRDVTVDVSSEGFYRTGIMCDIVQHAMLIPVLVCHLRFHKSLDILEKTLSYKFKNRYLLQLALTHPSYRENFGTNPDHARNSLTNCGISQPEYGDRRIHYMNTRKRGINTLINIMSRFGARRETESSIAHNERLEFLGDAVVEFLTSIHLFHMFPDLEEGGLATYRAAIVQNQHLAVLAKKLNLEQYMLYAHGSDLCHDLELRHAMANCFEALMGSLFLDGGISVADRVFGETLFQAEDNIGYVWVNYPKHPLQEQEPRGDRQWIPSFELLQKLTKFEESIGIEFTHIRMLARAFTDRSIGYTNLTLGSNQRLEFLGDTVLQLIVSEYLYKYFPEHHEGHLSLLRSSLVNNKTQAVVCDDLGMTQYALYGNPKAELKTKDRADLLEAFLGALYVDKGLEYCHVFCDVCFFPRLQSFIMNQDWNDPKSKLQQCCLTLRTMDGGEPDIPVYKVIECKGPTNTRVYTVAVYFQGKRLAKASGHSIQEAEMNSAKEALEKSQDLFPQLDHQRRVIAKSMKMQQWPNRSKIVQLDKGDDDNSSQSQQRRRRSRSRDREIADRRSRDRYDSSDRRHRIVSKNSSNERLQTTDGERRNKNSRKFSSSPESVRRNRTDNRTSDSDDSSKHWKDDDDDDDDDDEDHEDDDGNKNNRLKNRRGSQSKRKNSSSSDSDKDDDDDDDDEDEDDNDDSDESSTTRVN